MKLTLFIILISTVQILAGSAYSQNTRFTIVRDDLSIENMLKLIEDQSTYYFLYNGKLIDVSKRVSINVVDQNLEKTLSELLRETNISYQIVNRQVILSPRDNVVVASQQGSVSGKVTDSSGVPLPGVTVVIKGKVQGTVTAIDGNYSLQNVPGDGTLVFSFVGMKMQEISVSGKTTIDVIMIEDAIGIEEVVAIGYGTQRRREITGSMSRVDAADLGDLPVGQFAQKIQGKLSGLQVTQATGQPGRGMNFRIRGQASVNAGNSPLFVVDGFPITGDISNINPDEIISFTVLKDASATSLYGSRAANGVILVETKKGRSGKMTVDVNAYYGIQKITDDGPDIMNAREWAQFKKEFYEDKIRYENWKNSEGKAEVPDIYEDPLQYGAGTNWYKVLQQSAPIQNYNISINTGTEKVNSAIVLGYFKQDGTILNTSFERFSARANNTFKVNKLLTFGLNIAPAYTVNTNHNTDGGWQILSAAILMSPIQKHINDDGTMPIGFSEAGMFANPNWYRVLREKQDYEKSARLLANAYATVDILEGLQYKFRADIDMQQSNVRNFIPSTAGGGMFVAPPQKATGNYNTGFYTTWLTENTLTYRKEIKGHTFDALVGYTAQKYHWEGSSLSGTDYPSDEIPWIDAAATKNGGASANEWSLLSFISRLNYNYQGRYLLSLAFRSDGSSRFGSGNRWGNFPSVSAGWVASDESFLKDVNPISYLKLRASYGVVGNFNIGNYNYIAGIGTYNYLFGNSLSAGKALQGIGNEQLGWEETKQMDIGLDLGLFQDRISFVYDYYKKVTDGLLYQINIPRASGFSNIQSNIGQFDFWGHEFTLSSKNLVGELKWNTDFNISFNRNKVIKLGSNDTPQGGYSNQEDFNRMSVGEPLGYFMGYIYDGVYMTQQEFDSQPKYANSEVGTARMKDIDGPEKNGVPDGIIDANDRTKIGDPNPDFIYGMTNEFSWNNFDLSFVVAGTYGNDIINNMYQFTENLDGVFNVRKKVAERWRSLENPGNGEIPRTKDGTTDLFRFNNTRWISDGSYLAMKNLTLGYTLPIRKNSYIQRVRVYASVQNLFIITGYEGSNPEVSMGGLSGFSNYGVDNTTYPVPRVFSFGVNLSL